MEVLEDSSEQISQLYEKIPCRVNQINYIKSIFGKPHQYTPASVFIYGHTGTGKSLVVNSVLQTFKFPHVLVNFVECYSARFLYEMILNNLQGNTANLSDASKFLKCDNMNDFVRLFKQVCKEKGLDKETVYIILDRAERLRDFDINVLPAFLKLQELTQQNVCVVFMTEIVWEKFRTGTGYCEPLCVHFPDYSKDELLEILMLDKPDDYADEFYSMYINLLLSVFHMVCRDLKELQHLARINFPKYSEPVKLGEATETDTRKLWKNIEPHLKKALKTVYLREISSSQWEKMQQQESETGQAVSVQGLASKAQVELPYYSKYLLIAAYLASYNPVKSDKRFFVKLSSKTKKSKAMQKKNTERTSNHILGPKPFPLDRMMAIFYSIVEGKVATTANIFMQVSSLVSLHLLGHASGEDQIDTPKYKCLVSLDFIRSIARTVNFDVMRYLFDFV